MGGLIVWKVVQTGVRVIPTIFWWSIGEAVFYVEGLTIRVVHYIEVAHFILIGRSAKSISHINNNI